MWTPLEADVLIVDEVSMVGISLFQSILAALLPWGQRFDSRLVRYDALDLDLDELMLAYACSVHKSQGSEYPAVVIPIHTQHYLML